MKIGIAQKVKRRLSQIQTGNPIKLEVFHSIKVDSVEQAKEIEKECHKELQRYRLNGEWFEIDVLFGKKIINEAANPELKKRLNEEAKIKRINELRLELSRNKEEGQFLTSEMSITRKHLDELHNLWMGNLKEYGDITDEIRMLGYEP
jgi:hypothetical protein